MLTGYQKIEGIELIQINKYVDDRGTLEYVNFSLNLQKNENLRFLISSSNKNVLRGIHVANIQLRQNKIVYCARGSVLDVQVDLRKNSPTFMHHSIIQLNPMNGMILKIPPGVGHAFLALENDTIINYVINGDFKSEMEFSINPFSNAFAIDWPINGHVIISEKDSSKKDLSDLIDLINFIPNL